MSCEDREPVLPGGGGSLHLKKNKNRRWNCRMIRNVSVALLCFSFVYAGLGAATIWAKSNWYVAGIPIWGGLLYSIPALLGLVASRRNTTCAMVATFVLAIILSLLWTGMLGVSINNLSYDARCWNDYWWNYRYENRIPYTAEDCKNPDYDCYDYNNGYSDYNTEYRHEDLYPSDRVCYRLFVTKWVIVDAACVVTNLILGGLVISLLVYISKGLCGGCCDAGGCCVGCVSTSVNVAPSSAPRPLSVEGNPLCCSVQAQCCGLGCAGQSSADCACCKGNRPDVYEESYIVPQPT